MLLGRSIYISISSKTGVLNATFTFEQKSTPVSCSEKTMLPFYEEICDAPSMLHPILPLSQLVSLSTCVLHAYLPASLSFSSPFSCKITKLQEDCKFLVSAYAPRTSHFYSDGWVTSVCYLCDGSTINCSACTSSWSGKGAVPNSGIWSLLTQSSMGEVVFH